MKQVSLARYPTALLCQDTTINLLNHFRKDVFYKWIVKVKPIGFRKAPITFGESSLRIYAKNEISLCLQNSKHLVTVTLRNLNFVFAKKAFILLTNIKLKEEDGRRKLSSLPGVSEKEAIK